MAKMEPKWWQRDFKIIKSDKTGIQMSFRVHGQLIHPIEFIFSILNQ